MLTKKQMDRKLILRSIFEKWNPMAMGCYGNNGTEDCPLCKKYYHGGGGCYGCPISLKTGIAFCNDTPLKDMSVYKTDVDADLSNIIEAEIEFLIGLLAQEDQDNLEALHKEWCEGNYAF